MKVVTARNVHEALWKGICLLAKEGEFRPSRNGEVLAYPGPVTTHYLKPAERVLFWEPRDANPFFHFMECLWMINGQDDVEWLAQYNSNMRQYSDDGIRFHGAYGYRWREHFAKDQLAELVELLQNENDSRRAVIGIWDPIEDLNVNKKDIPCNLNIVFTRRRDPMQLDMTVFNRSNDIIWGAYGANAVHFSFLQEVMATMLGIQIGRYWQVSNDYHAYLEVFQKNLPILFETNLVNPYLAYKDSETGEKVQPHPIIHGLPQVEKWFGDLEVFMTEGNLMGFRTQFFRRVVNPIYTAWECWKHEKDGSRAMEALKECIAIDWKMACQQWLIRRMVG